MIDYSTWLHLISFWQTNAIYQRNTIYSFYGGIHIFTMILLSQCKYDVPYIA